MKQEVIKLNQRQTVRLEVINKAHKGSIKFLPLYITKVKSVLWRKLHAVLYVLVITSLQACACSRGYILFYAYIWWFPFYASPRWNRISDSWLHSLRLCFIMFFVLLCFPFCGASICLTPWAWGSEFNCSVFTGFKRHCTLDFHMGDLILAAELVSVQIC